MSKIIVALLVGCCFGALSLLTLYEPELIGPAGMVVSASLIPGFVLAIIVGGNVHAFPTWPIFLGNFVFYFAAIYVVWTIWERHTAKQNVDGR